MRGWARWLRAAVPERPDVELAGLGTSKVLGGGVGLVPVAMMACWEGPALASALLVGGVLGLVFALLPPSGSVIPLARLLTVRTEQDRLRAAYERRARRLWVVTLASTPYLAVTALWLARVDGVLPGLPIPVQVLGAFCGGFHVWTVATGAGQLQSALAPRRGKAGREGD